MKERLYHNLGWDYASFGFPIDDDSPQDMHTGYREGKAHFGHKTKPATIFDRKWLQLRKNALKRNRQFDDDVTPEFLSCILPPICPITRVELTTGTLTESDWSVDRICNLGAYSRRNLAVMSTRANQVKGNMTIQDILHRCEHPEEDTRLSMLEWRRMYIISQQVHISTELVGPGNNRLTPIITYYPQHLGVNWSWGVQYAFLDKLVRRKGMGFVIKNSHYNYLPFYGQLKATCDDTASAKLMHKIMARLERKFESVRYLEDLFWDNRTWELFEALVLYQIHRRKWPFECSFGDMESVEVDAPAKQKELAIAEKGYLSN